MELDKAADDLKTFSIHEVRSCQKDAFFIYGHDSEFLGPDDEYVIKTYFPNAILHGVEGIGHWVHAGKPDEFCEVIKKFLNNNEIN